MIDNALLQIKTEFESAIIKNGAMAQTSLIRSQKLINILHNQVKKEFIKLGINPNSIYPHIGECHPEIKMTGLLKAKYQDICIIPSSISNKCVIKNTRAELLENDKIDRVLSINIRSQLSSMAKNIDTLYERTFAEALNLHLKYPKICLGEVYLIPTHEYDSNSMKNNKIEYKKIKKLEDYISKFQYINSRNSDNGQEYKYERACLLIVDFRQELPKLYNNVEELKSDGLIKKTSDVTLNGLTFETFAKDMLKIYQQRFEIEFNLLKV